MFQAMVPSLLVKLNDLRKKPHIIFLINTNLRHRLDPALIRPGRIDRHILVLPPDKKGRKAVINCYCKNDKKIDICEVNTSFIAKQTPLFSYKELQSLIDDCISKNIELDKPAEADIENRIRSHSPTITLSNYLQNCKKHKEDNDYLPAEEVPLDEVVMTAYALYESDNKQFANSISDDLKEFIKHYSKDNKIEKIILTVMGEKTKEEVQKMINVIIAKEEAKG